jgi:hypothetical protein
MKAMLLLGLLLQTNTQSNIWRECTFDRAELCTASGCKATKPTLKVYLADYSDDPKPRGGYYYRCRIDGGCQIVEPFWVGYGAAGYRVWDAREKGALSRLSPDDKITDVVTLEDVVLISRGTCREAPPPIIVSRTK